MVYFSYNKERGINTMDKEIKKNFVNFNEIKCGEFFTNNFKDFYICVEYVADEGDFEANAVNLKDGSFEYFNYNDKVQKIEFNFYI